TSKLALERAKEENRILRICFETNGNMSPGFADVAMQLVLESGGVMKFDLKFWDETLNIAMCGISNKIPLENFKRLGEKYFEKRPEVPILTASTLLIPGYVDEEEVGKIAEFIAEINPEIPYSLLAFYPCFELTDLPTTSRRQALSCLKVAKEAGLKYVRIGNVHLLS
ncbi:MAG: radical SAM protein, partial [Thermoproteota archaeon]